MGLHEECGVFGVYDAKGGCAECTYYGLYALQHRGQEACGIAANNNREIIYHKDVGLVGDVFDVQRLREMNGTMAIGHVRYATTGAGRRMNAQPFVVNYVKQQLAVVHNGNLVNTEELRDYFEHRGAIFQTASDTEIIAYSIAASRLKYGSVEEAVNHSVKHLKGAFSIIVMSPRKLIAARDPWGFRPPVHRQKRGAPGTLPPNPAPWMGWRRSMSGRWSRAKSWWWRTATSAPSGTTARA